MGGWQGEAREGSECEGVFKEMYGWDGLCVCMCVCVCVCMFAEQEDIIRLLEEDDAYPFDQGTDTFTRTHTNHEINP